MSLLNTFRKVFIDKTDDATATIRQMKNGKFRLLHPENEVLGTYGRRRDAVRGATRRGLTVA